MSSADDNIASARRIPVVMYHTVGKVDPTWLWSGLVCSLPLFAAQIERLAARGYRAISLEELHEAQSRSHLDSHRRVVVTFDDGYLDNWVYVYPILKRAGWKGHVYVNPEFVDPGTRPRLNLEDVWAGRCAEGDLQPRGFLNWAEIEILDRSGVLEICSHSMSHTWYATGPELLDFHRPGLVTPWLAWNARPDRKPFYLNEDQSMLVPWGTPILRNGRSLGIRRWFPDPDVAAAVTAHVAANGGAACFDAENWRAQLEAVAREADRGQGRTETDDEMYARFVHEIAGASAILSARLGRVVRHFCWPGGAYCDSSWAVASESGFRTLTVKPGDHVRWRSSDPRLVRRISDHRQYSFLRRTHQARDASLLACACDVELGRPWSRTAMRLRKALDAAGAGWQRGGGVRP